jgi:hypothetical protein
MDSNHHSCPNLAKQSRTDSKADALDLKQELNKVQKGANLSVQASTQRL